MRVQLTPPRVIAQNERREITASLVLDDDYPKLWIERRGTREGSRPVFIALPLSRVRELGRVVDEVLEAGARHAAGAHEQQITCRVVFGRCARKEGTGTDGR